MTLSAVDLTTVKGFLRVDHSADDLLIAAILKAATSYVLSYTGLTPDEAAEYEDLAVACLVLCSDMYDNRQMTVENGAVNKVTESILGLHQRNLV